MLALSDTLVRAPDSCRPFYDALTEKCTSRADMHNSPLKAISCWIVPLKHHAACTEADRWS